MTQCNLGITADRLKELRLERNMTIYGVSDVIGVTAATISRYEAGLIEPRKSIIEKYAQNFKVNPLWLIGATEEKYDEASIEGTRIPILGTIAAGVPIAAQEPLGYTWVPSDSRANFALRVRGDSMVNARIFEGDYVFVAAQPDVENGEIAVVMVDGETTLKRVMKVNGNVVLQSENPAYKPMIYTKHDKKEVKILGKVIMVQFEVKTYGEL